MDHSAQALIFLIIAVATFLLKGKQWPTAITMFLAAWYLAGESIQTLPNAAETVFKAVNALWS